MTKPHEPAYWVDSLYGEPFVWARATPADGCPYTGWYYLVRHDPKKADIDLKFGVNLHPVFTDKMRNEDVLSDMRAVSKDELDMLILEACAKDALGD